MRAGALSLSGRNCPGRVVQARGLPFGEIMKSFETKKILDDLHTRVAHIIESAPAKDIEKKIRALMTQTFSRFDLVTREEFEWQTQTIAQLRDEIAALQIRLARLEKMVSPADDKGT